jgi:signal transduction histidine kinase
MQAQPSTLQHLVRMPSAPRSTASSPGPISRRWSGSRASFLAEASKRLAASLDLATTVQCMTELSVPELGDACLICLLSDTQTVTEVSARHVDPQRQELLAALGKPPLRNTRGWQLVLHVAQGRRPAILSQLSTAVLLGGSGAPHVVLNDLGLKTALLVPVVDQELQRTLAVVVFLSERTRQYGVGQLRLAEDLTARFALALEAAEMYRACQAALEDRQESLATTVHDLMSPLTYIKGTAQRLRCLEERLTEPHASAEFRKRLEAIDSAANRMASALTTLLKTTGPQPEGWPQENRRAMDLVEVTRRVVAEQQLVARQHSIRFRDTPKRLEGVWDVDHIERMLGNLIGNAIKYSPPGGLVEVSLAGELDDEGRWAVLRVADQGLGIPATDLPFVFEPYRRGSNVGDVAGTGLGLASVWQTVKTHEGRLWVDSEEDKGTCVTVRLPVEPRVTAARSTGR